MEMNRTVLRVEGMDVNPRNCISSPPDTRNPCEPIPFPLTSFTNFTIVIPLVDRTAQPLELTKITTFGVQDPFGVKICLVLLKIIQWDNLFSGGFKSVGKSKDVAGKSI